MAQKQKEEVVIGERGTALTGEVATINLNDTVWLPNPKKATMLSAAIPGAGQIYNRQWWKVPILYAGIATVGYFINWNNSAYIRYRNAYLDYVDSDPSTNRYNLVLPEGYVISDASWFESTLENRQEGYRHDRDMLIIAMTGIYVLNILEANVAAHLYDFDVSDDLSMHFLPRLDYNIFSQSATMGVSLKFTINK